MVDSSITVVVKNYRLRHVILRCAQFGYLIKTALFERKIERKKAECMHVRAGTNKDGVCLGRNTTVH